MKVGQKQHMGHILATAGVSLQAGDVDLPEGMLQKPSSQPQNPSLPSVATVSKMFATDNKYVMLVSTSDQTSRKPTFYLFASATLALLRLLDKSTGFSQSQVLMDNTCASPSSELFLFKAQCTTTDMAGANYAAESALLNKRGEGWGGLHLACNMHVIARAFAKTFSLMENQVSGMIHMALCLSLGGTMQRFRRAMVQVVAERLKVTSGVLPPQAAAYKDFVLRLFCAQGRNLAVRQFLLQHYAISNWRSGEVIELFVPPGVAFSREALLQNLCNALTLALVGSLFRIYPRHRWVGCDATLDQIGLSLAVHNLAGQAFQRVLSGLPDDPTGPSRADSRICWGRTGSCGGTCWNSSARRPPHHCRPRS